MNLKNDPILLQELGIKLANFRRKLALAIGQHKLTQWAFGEMFGGQSPRQITSYERGEVDPPASLLYQIWKSGNSIDGIFEEKAITDSGKTGAKKLYGELAVVKLETMDEATIERVILEGNNAKQSKVKTSKTNLTKHSGKSKERRNTARPAKKR
jgi:hypothetical protein